MKLSIKNGAENSADVKQLLNFLGENYLSENGADKMILVEDIDNICKLFGEGELVHFEHESFVYYYAMIGDVLFGFHFRDCEEGIHQVMLTLNIGEKSIENVSENVAKVVGEPLIEEIEQIDLRELVSRAKQYRG